VGVQVLLVTVSEMVVVAVRLPEVPVIVTVDVPVVAVLLAVNVTTLDPVVGLVPNAAVTPLGRPVAARVTEPVNGLTSVTVIVSVPDAPWAIDRVDAEREREKLPVPVEVTVSAMVVVALKEPEVPVIVTVDVPVVAVLLAVNVTTLDPVVGLVPNAAVTPLGNPDAASVTEPVNGLTSVTVIVSVPLAPWAIDRVDAERESEKLPVPVEVTVSAMVVVALKEPEVPVIVTVDVPVVAVLLAVNVTTLDPVVGLVPNAAVTPLGKPEAARVTEPANGLTSVTVIVSVPLAPCAIDRVDAEGLSVKLPVAPQVVPLTANDVGTAFVVPFQVPLNPTPDTVPPAATLPL
jgi:hypothetical protein